MPHVTSQSYCSAWFGMKCSCTLNLPPTHTNYTNTAVGKAIAWHGAELCRWGWKVPPLPATLPPALCTPHSPLPVKLVCSLRSELSLRVVSDLNSSRHRGVNIKGQYVWAVEESGCMIFCIQKIWSFQINFIQWGQKQMWILIIRVMALQSGIEAWNKMEGMKLKMKRIE